jgi:hypothetical protein
MGDEDFPYIYKKGPAFGMPGVRVDGMDVLKVRNEEQRHSTIFNRVPPVVPLSSSTTLYLNGQFRKAFAIMPFVLFINMCAVAWRVLLGCYRQHPSG